MIMIRIGDKVLPKKQLLSENLEQIQEYLRTNHLILVDEEDNPLTEDQIIQQLQEEYSVFKVQDIRKIELQTISEAIQYIEQAVNQLNEIIESNDNNIIIRSFVEIMESLLYFQKLTKYFSMDNITFDKIEANMERALEQIEKKNVSYIIDLIEFEVIPLLLLIKRSLEERKRCS